MQTITHHNNIAVALIRHRDFVAAAKIFSRTLKSFQNLVATNRNSFSCTSESTRTSASNCLDEGMLLPKVNENSDDIFAGSDFIYDQGILIPDPLIDPLMVSVILIFNSAISHHLCAKQYPQHSTQYLLQARSLYSMAYQMQATSANNVLFRVAVINNSAVIERELGNEAGCRMFFDCLMSIWAISVDQEHRLRLLNMRNFLWNFLGKNDAAGAA